MQTSSRRTALLAALISAIPGLAIAAPGIASAQAVGAVDDARVLPKGALRIGALSDWTRYHERYGKGTPGRKDGSLEPLGVNFTTDSLGPAQLENLAAVESGVRALAGMPDFNASLGKMVVQLRNRILTTPLLLEMGITSRLTVGVLLPFVTASSEVDLRMNPTALNATLGFNPTLSTPSAIAANAQLLAQFDSAAALLGAQLTFCASNPASNGCGALNANASSARGLIANSGSLTASIGQLYGGRNGGKGALFVPISGTAAEAAIEARVAAYRAMYATFGFTTITSNGPFAAQAPLTSTDLQRVLTDTTFGIRAKPLTGSLSRGIGDIDLTVKFKLIDTFKDLNASFAPAGFNLRQSLGGVYRLGTGTLNAPDNFADIGTGQHQSDVEMRSFTDVLLGRHFWVSLVARYNVQMADQRVMRILDSPYRPLAAAFRQETVMRNLGDEFNLTVTPRWTLNDFIGFTARYDYRRKFSDAYSGQFSVTNLAGQSVVIDASVLGLNTEAREHRLGIGVSYSTVAAFERGAAAFPLEISYIHSQTTLGSGGAVPKLAVDQLEVRWYRRLFGR